MKKEFKGLTVVNGTGKGKARIVDCSCPDYKVRKIDDCDKELGRFVRILKQYCADTRELINYTDKNIGHRESRILESHIKMVHDLALQSELIDLISNGMCAEEATNKICDSYISRFLETDVEFVRQLAVDVMDLKTNVLNLLLGIDQPDVEHFEEDTVVLSKELTPSVFSRIDLVHTKAIVVEYGNPNSHCAQIHRATGIPGMIRARGILSEIHDGDVVEFDGETGTIRVV